MLGKDILSGRPYRSECAACTALLADSNPLHKRRLGRQIRTRILGGYFRILDRLYERPVPKSWLSGKVRERQFMLGVSGRSRALVRPASIQWPVCVVERSLGLLFRGWTLVVETDIRNPNLNGGPQPEQDHRNS